MNKTFGLAILAFLIAAPAGAQMMASAPGGSAALQYYVGSWACEAGQVGQTPSKATATYTMDNGMLRSWIVVPAQGKMQTFSYTSTAIWDAKNHRYVQSAIDSTSSWSIDYAKPWTGNTEVWTDHAISSGKLGYSHTVRVSATKFTFESFPSMTDMKPAFKGSCTKAS